MAVLNLTQLLAANYTDSSGTNIGTSNYMSGTWDTPHGTNKGIGALIENNDGSLTFIMWHDDYYGNSGDGDIYFDRFQFIWQALNNNGAIDKSASSSKYQCMLYDNKGTPPSSYITYQAGYTGMITNFGYNTGNSAIINYYQDMIGIFKPADNRSYNAYRARLYPSGGPGTIIQQLNICHWANGHTQNLWINDGTWSGQTSLTLSYKPVVIPTLSSVTPSTSYVNETVIVKGQNFQSGYNLYFSYQGLLQPVQFTYIDTQTASMTVPNVFIGTGLIKMFKNDYLGNPTIEAYNELQFTVVQQPNSVLYSSSSIEVSAPFGVAPINLIPGTLTINGPDSIIEAQTGTYGAVYTPIGGSPIDVTLKSIWSSTRAASFYGKDGIYHAALPKGIDIITAKYYPFIDNPPNVPTVQDPSTVIATTTKTMTIIDDRVGTLRIAADNNPVRSDSSTQLHVFITNPGVAEQDITATSVITSTIPNTVKPGAIYSNPAAQQTGIIDNLHASAVDANGNTITATYVMNTIVIYPKVLSLIPGNPSVMVGTTQQFQAKEFDPNTNTITFPVATWSEQSILGAGIINSSGLFTATGIGTQVIVSAVAQDGSGLSASTNVQVTAQIPQTHPVPTLTITPTNPTIQVNNQIQFLVTKTDYQGTVSNPLCSWVVNDIDGIGTITQSGVFTAVRPGSNVQVTATTEDADAASIATTVHINPLPSVVHMNVIPPSAIVLAGNTQQFTIAAVNSNGELVDPEVTWTVTDVNGTGNIDHASGLFTGEIAGKSIIVTATGPVQPDGTQPTATASVVVVAGQAVRILVNPPNVQKIIGGGQQFTAIGYDAYNNAVSLTNPSPTWSIIGGMGTVDQSGLFSATHEGIGQVTATQNNVSGSAHINVLRVVGGVTITSVPQQPFARIHIRNPIKDSILIDTRVRGGGIRNASALPSSDDFWWDISKYDGTPFQPFGVYVVKASTPPVSTVSISDLNPAQITNTLSKYAAPHFLGIIMPTGV